MTSEHQAAGSYQTTTLAASDGHSISVLHWPPANGEAKASVQILHGLAEHAARYDRFARVLTAEGFAVVAHNHRGHGAHLGPAELGHFADEDGWAKVLDDVQAVSEFVTAQYTQQPRLLLGHSMGTYIAQAHLMQRPDAADALVLSASTNAPRLQLYLGRFAARIEMWRHGASHRSAALNAQAFGAYNKRYAPARTDFDWLSRDPDEVDKYVNDPACGFLPSAALWHDLLGGLLNIGKASSRKGIPATLPILITGGSDDPVGGRRGMQALANAYEKCGHKNVDLKVYDDGRHEMLNETNRDEFTRDITAWAETALGLAPT